MTRGRSLLAAAAGALAAPGARRARSSACAAAPRGRAGARAWRCSPGSAAGSARAPPRGLAARIAAAGLDAPVDDVMAVKAGAALAGPAPARWRCCRAAPGRIGLALLAAAPGRRLPRARRWLAPARPRAAAARSRPSWPTCSTCCASRSPPGSSPARALARGRPPPPGPARRRAAPRRRARPRSASRARRPTRELERRCPAAGIPALVAALERADRHGAPLGPALAAEAARRARPRRAARRRGGRARRAADPARRRAAARARRCCCSSRPRCCPRSCRRVMAAAGYFSPATERATARRRRRRSPPTASTSNASRYGLACSNPASVLPGRRRRARAPPASTSSSAGSSRAEHVLACVVELAVAERRPTASAAVAASPAVGDHDLAAAARHHDRLRRPCVADRERGVGAVDLHRLRVAPPPRPAAARRACRTRRAAPCRRR